MGDEGVISLQRQGKGTPILHLRMLAAGTCALLATLTIAPQKSAAQSTSPAERIVLTNPSEVDADREADRVLAGDADDADDIELDDPRPIQTFEQPEDTVLIEADEMVHDREVDVVTASGNVEVTSDSRVLLADSIVYDRGTKTVTANGNVSLLQPDGQVMFADSMVLSDDFADAVGETVRLLLEENARIAANSGTRRAGNRTELKKAVYTVCDVCEEDPNSSPLWQIRSFNVIHDKEKKRVEYEDAFLEFFGVPIMYTPYFSHPDPTVKRLTGLLTPTVAVSPEFGTTVRTPFFWNIAPNMDFTFRPRWQTQVGDVYAGEFRHHIGFGQYKIDASATWPDEETVRGTDIEPFRGHVFADGQFDITKKTQAGFDLKLTSDETYLRRYDIFNENDLISTAYVRTIDDRNFARAEAFYFQGLQANDDQASIPFVTPLVDAEYYLEPLVAGGQVKGRFNALNLQRTEGTSFQRFSGDIGWDISRTAKSGEQFGAFADMRGDVYLVDEDVINGVGQNKSSVQTRVMPTVGVEYRWPWISTGERSSQIIEPIVQAIYSPSNSNPRDIPNDDSLSVDFDTTHLFDRNRYPGLDRFEDGARVNYGLQYSLLGDNGGQANILLGQSYRLEESATFPAGSGLQDSDSDVVGRVQINPGPYLDIVSRFRADPKDGKLLRNEVSLTSSFNLFEDRGVGISANYVFLDADLDTVNNREGEEVTGSFSFNFAENWWMNGHARRDLRRAEMVSDGVGLTYQDECFLFSLNFNQSFIRDRDIEPTNSVTFRIQLVSLGEFGASTTVSSAQTN
ncbi:Organic solvent tolerance protein [Candidatus Phaeomarinobacter ectocarpi]|uniref:LPS-assembly protein LptD n=1 Tax=Candidatus Phaeomarinibacter ectocarpi TaxID=1458461 RepID=X5MAI9_9HYPH|nr:LPS assembly protein LptD [Candidatus Phaeomarinobacter ectocarpi]CDO60883.1 Organic solvent tolerance protein [Candidatus Phaeomarinobacter ectocarpi]